MNDMKKTFRIETEDRYGRLDEYEGKAANKVEAEAIANKPVNIPHGSGVIDVVEITPEPVYDDFRDMLPDSHEYYMR